VSARRIAFINEKGGTGKTTLAVNCAAYFAQKKQRRVLLIDLDTQGHAGKSLGIDAREATPNIFDVLTNPAVPLAAAVRPTAVAGLFVLPSWKNMARFPEEVAGQPDRERRLAQRLDAEAAGFEMVVLDAPPSFGLTTINILLAATEVVIPVATTYLSLDGCAEMVETVRRINDEHQHPLRISLVVPTLYRKTAMADAILEKLARYFPQALAKHPLALNVAIDEAQSHGKTIWEHAPWSRGATMLQQMAEELEAAGAAAGPVRKTG
jgi:chromosome partitioning protein